MESSYPPSLTPAQEEHLISSLRAWATSHGLLVRPALDNPLRDDPKGVFVTHAPVTLFPSRFPRDCFETAIEVQQVYNYLYAAIANDEKWLKGVIVG